MERIYATKTNPKVEGIIEAFDIISNYFKVVPSTRFTIGVEIVPTKNLSVEETFNIIRSYIPKDNLIKVYSDDKMRELIKKHYALLSLYEKYKKVNR